VPANTQAPRRAAIFFSVPSGLRGRQCRACPAWIYDVQSPKHPGRTFPVHCDVEGGKRPLGDAPGMGINHFIDCADPDRFRRPR
jgi:hypothetical protein